MKQNSNKITIHYIHLRDFNFNTLAERGFSYEREDIDNTEIGADIFFETTDKPYHYTANVNCALRPRLKNGKHPFAIYADYLVGVSLEDEEMEESEIRKRLHSAVRDEVFSSLRAKSWEMTYTSSFPPLIPKIEKECQEEVVREYDKPDEEERDNEEEFDFNTFDVFDDIDNDEEDEDEDNTENEEIQDNFIEAITDIDSGNAKLFRQTTAYKYYYHFFEPVAYNHPDIPALNEAFWESFFQLLFGTDSKASIIIEENNTVELEFCDLILGRRRVSSLNDEEVNLALLNVAIRASREYANSLLCVITERDHAYYHSISTPPIWHEYRNLFTTPDGFISDWREEEAHKLYQKIKRCNDETFLCRMAYM